MSTAHLPVSLASLLLSLLTACARTTSPAPPATPPFPWPTASPDEPAPGALRVWPSDSAPMVFVPTGHFLQGASEDDGLASDNERPAHWAHVTGFWIDQLELTNARYGECVAASACRPPLASGSHSRNEYFGSLQFADYPVIFLSWADANSYCEWAGRRLPTEAEWERAARGDDGRRWPWGDEWGGTRANFCDSSCPHRWRDASASDGFTETSPVGSFPSGASPFGALDMAGNVFEWVSDWYAEYAADAVLDPIVSEGVEVKLLRGGSFDFVASGLRATFRYEDSATHRQDSFGFRCAADGSR